MRLIGVLLGPALLAILLMQAVPREGPQPPKEPPIEPRGLPWAGRVFTSERQFARWLEDRGGSYKQWRARHPASPWSDPPERTLSAAAPRSDDDRGWLGLLLAFGSVAAVGGVGLVAVSRVRRRRLLVRPFDDVRAAPDRRALSAFALLGVGFALAVRRGAEVLWAIVSIAAPRAWRAVRRGLELLRVETPVAANAVRRGATQAVGAADELYEQVQQRAGETRALRTVLGYGAVTMASGALGVAIAIALG
jgi:hypothetical protein